MYTKFLGLLNKHICLQNDPHKLKQGFYNSVKIKFQEYSRSFPGVICFFYKSPVLDKTLLYEVTKCVYNYAMRKKISSPLIIAISIHLK